MPSTIATDKAALRARLEALPYPACGSLTARFLALNEVAAAETILLFYGVAREPDTVPVIEALLASGKTVLLPRCLPGRAMEARVIHSLEGLVLNPFGIPEPSTACPTLERNQIQLILVPNLCCDRENYRLGHGGGYYDRYLAGYAGLTVALCPHSFLQRAVPRDAFDLPVRLVIT